jgi:hypothetical protein
MTPTEQHIAEALLGLFCILSVSLVGYVMVMP